METKKCKYCLIDKLLTSFYLNKRTKDGRTNRCNECMKIYKVELRLRKRRDLYEPDSIQEIIFDYLGQMKVYILPDEMKKIIARLEVADNFFAELDAIQDEVGAKFENYKDNFLEVLRNDRIAVQALYVSRGTGRHAKRRVNQLDLEGNHIQTHESIAAAAMAVVGNLSATGAISACANGLCYHCYGFIFEYDDTYKEEQ